jgi:sec-independent protein translocase protein TatA
MFGKVEELVVVLVIILVLFGAKKLPELSKGISQSVREIRKGFRDDTSENKPVARETKRDQPET